ncbi:hypothetical protein Goshw_024351, partial [Gossypium schwendimanii]|nr:hypothetical protein [Gossypium schwendimanii]
MQYAYIFLLLPFKSANIWCLFFVFKFILVFPYIYK